jgi:hypothetical protein
MQLVRNKKKQKLHQQELIQNNLLEIIFINPGLKRPGFFCVFASLYFRHRLRSKLFMKIQRREDAKKMFMVLLESKRSERFTSIH